MSYALTPEDEAAIQGGLQAEALLGMPFFSDMLADLTLSAATEILETEDSEAGSKRRERLFYKVQGLQEIQMELNQRVARKEEILMQLEALQAAEEAGELSE